MKTATSWVRGVLRTMNPSVLEDHTESFCTEGKEERLFPAPGRMPLLSRMFLDGRGGVHSPLVAVRLFRSIPHEDLLHPSSLECSPDSYAAGRIAAESLAALYREGVGIKKDEGRGVQKAHGQAAVWYEKAANLGQPHAMKNLGHAYIYGLGVTQDQQVGKKWLLRAAEAGEPNAMYSVGRIFEHGVAGVRDYEEAARWYKKASSLGHDGALRSLANFYEKGLGVGQDLSEAETLLKRAEDIKRQF